MNSDKRHVCSQCSTPLEVRFSDEFEPENFRVSIYRGLTLDLSGYYGGFTDAVGEDLKYYQVTLCHDCCLRVIRALPNVFRPGTGHHPSLNDDKPCCEFCWTTRDGQDFVANENLEWVPLETKA